MLPFSIISQLLMFQSGHCLSLLKILPYQRHTRLNLSSKMSWLLHRLVLWNWTSTLQKLTWSSLWIWDCWAGLLERYFPESPQMIPPECVLQFVFSARIVSGHLPAMMRRDEETVVMINTLMGVWIFHLQNLWHDCFHTFSCWQWKDEKMELKKPWGSSHTHTICTVWAWSHPPCILLLCMHMFVRQKMKRRKEKQMPL